MHLAATIECKPVGSCRDTPLDGTKVVIVQTGNNGDGNVNDGGDLYIAMSNYEQDKKDTSNNMTAKNEDGNDVSLVYSECDESGFNKLDDDELAGLAIDLGILSEEVLIADDDLTTFDELTSISPTKLAAVGPTIFPTVALEEPVEDGLL